MGINLYIIGIKHCGKSSVGKLLSEKLSLPFYDLDNLVENVVGCSVRDLYKDRGREAFLTEEYNALKTLSLTEGYVCATGGGICDNIKACQIFKSTDYKIFIDTAFETIFERVMFNGVPAFLKSDDPQKEFKEIYSKRRDRYRDMANITISGNCKSVLDVTREIIKRLEESDIARK